MIDYFEAIGRLVSYPELQIKLPSGPALQPKLAILTKDQKDGAWRLDQRIRLDFRANDYDDLTYIEVQENFADVLGEGFISFPSAGELLWTYNRLQNANANVKGWYNTLVTLAEQATRGLPGPSTAYFIALGAMVVDKKFVEKLKANSQDRETLLAKKFLRRLSEREKEQIEELARGDFGSAAQEFSKAFWDEMCGPGLFRMENEQQNVAHPQGAVVPDHSHDANVLVAGD
ncbi:MAG: hypothetical protein JO091_06510 [Acidobacteriaceae bacterium]|nr:hypothetical protein [Acidobacteriaceae bacterium]MBV9612104.1 hypothetical protein [Acidobacteriaceae bacterium]